MESDKIILFPLNLDAMLRACVPDGSSSGQQEVADDIRAWFDSNSRPGDDPEWIDVRVVEALRRYLKPGQKVIWRTAMRWRDDSGILQNHYEQASVENLEANFGYEIIVNAGCAAIIRDPKTSTIQHDASKEGQPRLFAKGVEAIREAAATKKCPLPTWVGRHSVSEINNALGRAFPNDQVAAIKAQEAVLPLVREMENRLILMDKHAAIDNGVIQMLIVAGYITNDVAAQAFKIAHGFEDGQLPPAVVSRPFVSEPTATIRDPKPAANRSWWKDVKPETDLAEANDVIGCMLEDWQKVGEALGFKDFADPESIIGLCKELFDESPKPDAAEALALLDGIIAKFERDNEHGFDADLRSLRRILTAGTKSTQSETTAADEFADIREFRRREAEMDRRDAEQLAERHDEILRGQFPRDASARDKAHAAVTDFVLDALNVSGGSAHEPPAVMVVEFSGFPDNESTRKLMDEVGIAADQYRINMAHAPDPHISGGLQPFPFDGVPKDGSIPVYGGDPEFDALPVGAGSVPETPVPMADDPTWKRDEEKTMLRILLLSADTTGFHGNDPAVHIARIAKWTDDECRAVDDWCVAMHLHAGDRGVRVPPKPDVLVSERPEAADSDTLTVIAQARGPISAKELERAVVSIIVAETRYPEHHFSHAAKRIAELLTRGSAE